MEIIPIKELFTAENHRRIRDELKRNGILIYPTDTLYGLGGNFLSARVTAKVDSLKQRSSTPYSAAVASYEMISKLVTDDTEIFRTMIEKLFPGPYTLITTASENIGAGILKSGFKIGIRMPDHPAILKLIEYLGFPLISTSVNKTDSIPLRDPQQMIKQFPSVDYFIDAGIIPESSGSTVIDLTADPVVVRRTGDGWEPFKKLAIPFTLSL